MSDYADIGVQYLQDIQVFVRSGDLEHCLWVSATVTPAPERLEVTGLTAHCRSCNDAVTHEPVLKGGCGIVAGWHARDHQRDWLEEELCSAYRDLELERGRENVKRQKFLQGTATLKHMLETGSRIEELERALAAVLEALPDAERVTRVVQVALGKGGAS